MGGAEFQAIAAAAVHPYDVVPAFDFSAQVVQATSG